MVRKYNITTAQAKRLYITMKDINDILLANNVGSWYQEGNLHRDGDQPAVIYATGTQYWYQI